MADHAHYLQQCLTLAQHSATSGGGPFAAIVVKQGEIIAKACNAVTQHNDPTAHAEVLAIRQACAALGSHQLQDCTLYSSCEPCPMCFGAIYWARPAAVYYAASREQAAAAGFDDSLIYQQIATTNQQRSIPFQHLTLDEANRPFVHWRENSNKIDY